MSWERDIETVRAALGEGECDDGEPRMTGPQYEALGAFARICAALATARSDLAQLRMVAELHERVEHNLAKAAQVLGDAHCASITDPPDEPPGPR